MFSRKKSLRLVVLIFLILSVSAAVFFAYRHYPKENEKAAESARIGWATDIHAGKEKADSDRGESPFPREYKEYLEKFFDEMEKQGIKTAIFGGDTTNRSHKETARRVYGIIIGREKSQKIKTLIAKGNHDGPITMGILGFENKKFYYHYDIANARIIVLDNTILQPNDAHYAGEYYGGIDHEQLLWLKETLKTEKNAIIIAHIPIFYKDENHNGEILMQYKELERIIRESQRVKMVLFGHFHEQWAREYNGIKYYSLYALTQGGHKGSYAIIDTKDFSVEYKILGQE